MDYYRVGSTLLNISNSKDVDFLVFKDDLNPDKLVQIKTKYSNADFRIRFKDDVIKCMQFKTEDYINMLVNYQLDSRIIGQNFPIKYNILDYKDKIILMLKNIIKNRMLNFNKQITAGNNCCSKLIYHIAYNLFIIKNNSPIITPEQKGIIQKIHDRQMPISYLDELEKEIEAL